jgi:predicted phage tail protein
MKHVTLYGELGRRFGKHWRLDVASPEEALRAINANRPGFYEYILDCERKGQRFKVFVGRDELKDSSDLLLPCSGREFIRIVPVVQGGGGAASIIIGAILFPFAPTLGANLMLSGFASLLVDVPETRRMDQSQDPQNRPSYVFNGPEQVIAQGGCVPVTYGLIEVGSTVISAGIYTTDIPLD